jgi:hypothetical protein
LVPRPNGKNVAAVALGRVLLGLAGDDAAVQAGSWPTVAHAALLAHVDDPGAPLDQLRAQWIRNPLARELRDEVVAVVVALGGMATAEEVAQVLLATHGSTAEGADRMLHALALVRVAVEGDVADDAPELEVSRPRGSGRVLLAVEGEDGTAAARLAAARSVAEIVDGLVATDEQPVSRNRGLTDLEGDSTRPLCRDADVPPEDPSPAHVPGVARTGGARAGRRTRRAPPRGPVRGGVRRRSDGSLSARRHTGGAARLEASRTSQRGAGWRARPAVARTMPGAAPSGSSSFGNRA